MKLFDDTQNVSAMFYLDYSGLQITRREFLQAFRAETRHPSRYDLHGYMLYVGDGYVPLTIAVLAYNESDAIGAFEDWCRRTGREDEIAEDDESIADGYEGEYQLVIQQIPDARRLIAPRFRVLEWSNGFEVEDLDTGETAWMSDGVDVLFDENDEPISPGTEGFVERWEAALNASEDETLEAYFYETWQEEAR